MLELYVLEDCPFCQKVRRKMNELGIDFIYRSHLPQKMEESWGFKIGGKTMVPLLVDQSKNVVMYESDDIVAYLEENYA
jgi:glutathione S-transferase